MAVSLSGHRPFHAPPLLPKERNPSPCPLHRWGWGHPMRAPPHPLRTVQEPETNTGPALPAVTCRSVVELGSSCAIPTLVPTHPTHRAGLPSHFSTGKKLQLHWLCVYLCVVMCLCVRICMACVCTCVCAHVVYRYLACMCVCGVVYCDTTLRVCGVPCVNAPPQGLAGGEGCPLSFPPSVTLGA